MTTIATVPFGWQDSYRLGIDVMDTQHRRLCHLAIDVQTALNDSTCKDDLLRSLADLKRYTEIHFLSEEEFLRRARFPELHTHIAEHQKLLDNLQALHKDVREDNAQSSTESLVALLISLDDHIGTADHRYGEFIRENRRLLD